MAQNNTWDQRHFNALLSLPTGMGVSNDIELDRKSSILKSVAERGRTTGLEHAVIQDQKSKRVKFVGTGTSNYVSLDVAVLGKNGRIIHNHPLGGSFSPQDLSNLQTATKAKYIYAVSSAEKNHGAAYVVSRGSPDITKRWDDITRKIIADRKLVSNVPLETINHITRATMNQLHAEGLVNYREIGRHAPLPSDYTQRTRPQSHIRALSMAQRTATAGATMEGGASLHRTAGGLSSPMQSFSTISRSTPHAPSYSSVKSIAGKVFTRFIPGLGVAMAVIEAGKLVSNSSTKQSNKDTVPLVKGQVLVNGKNGTHIRNQMVRPDYKLKN
jgi:hypothetical protein